MYEKKLTADIDRLDRLEAEIGAQRNILLNALRNRRDHPTFGYTKARLREELNKLVGMMEAWAYLTVWDHAGRVLMDTEMIETYKHYLAVDWLAIERAVREA